MHEVVGEVRRAVGELDLPRGLDDPSRWAGAGASSHPFAPASSSGMTTPAVVVFDVNETLSDMDPLARRLAEVGAPELAAKVWLASLLRDGFALAAAGANERFSLLGTDPLRAVLSDLALTTDLDATVDEVTEGFGSLGLHPEVPDTVRVLPAPGAYAYAAQACSVGPAERLLVAVHPWDIDDAQRAGMRTCGAGRRAGPYPRYFRPPLHTVRTLSELAPLVG
ncbi:MAG: haloacid dehalogenase type II [Acidimicrobiales bacterium]